MKRNKTLIIYIDNIFRFSQAGSEVSALLGRMPSGGWLSTTLATEMGQLQENYLDKKRPQLLNSSNLRPSG